MIKTYTPHKKTGKIDYGRFDWKMEFPKCRDDVRLADDDTLIKWYRFLPPPLGDRNKGFILSDIVFEVRKRFIPAKE